MEALGIYLLKVSALMGVFYLAYVLFLRKETFFNSNRWFLLSGLIVSIILPFITYTKIVWVDPSPVAYDYVESPLADSLVAASEPVFEINWFLIAMVAYGIGISIFFIKFVIDCYAIKQIIEKPKAIKRSNFYLIDTENVQSPFSFFNYIVYNSTLLKEDELENILNHERVHSAQKHSLDMLLAQIFCILLWFNPIVWLYKKAIAQNLEFIADAEATKQTDDLKGYQKTLLKVTMQSNCIAITNPFYQSLIKKRIVMLNKNQSDKRNSWKYFVVLPLLAFFMFQFQMRVLAQEKPTPKVENREISTKVISVVIDKNSTDADIKKDAAMLKSDFGVTLKVSKVKRNSNAEITGIKVDYKDKDGRKGTTQTQSDSPIQPIRFFKEMDENGKATAIGFGRPNERERRSALAGIPRIQRLSEDGENIEIFVEGDEEDFTWTDNFDFDFDIEVPELPEGVDAPEPPAAMTFARVPRVPGAPGAPGLKSKSVIIKQDGEQREVWVDGEKIAEDVLKEMEAEGIGNVYVYSDKGPKGPKGPKGAKGFVYHDENGKVVISKKEIEKISKDAMEKSKTEMKKMKRRMEEMKPEMERTKIRMREAQPEMEQARAEMLKAKEEMLKAKEEMEKAKIELEKAKSSLTK